MGRDSTVTFEQIAAIADTMKMESVKVTSRAVRERLGNTGSMGTINKLLGRWKSGQKRQISAALVLPPALQRVLLEFMDTELTAARTALESDLADQQQEASDLATENERQVVENELQTEAIELLRAEVATHQGRAGQLESDLVVCRDEASRERSGAELARIELAKAQLRLEAMPRLEADLMAMRDVLDTERSAAELSRTELAKAQLRLEVVPGLQADLLALREALDFERTTRVVAEQTAAVLAAKLDAADRRATEAIERTAQADAIAAQLAAKAEAVAHELLSANAAGQSRLEAMERALEDAKKSVATATAAANKAGEEAAELRGKLTATVKQEKLKPE